ENKAKEAAARAIRSPLLEANIKGAKSAIINITGGPNISLQDSSIAVDFIKEAAGNDIDIIYGVAINESLGEAIIVTVIATGFDLPNTSHTAPAQTNLIFDRPAANTVPFEDAEKRQDEVVTNNEDDDVPSFFKTRI
nr:cell division protein FtsZ [Erysipelotrichaceae bacterium]